MPDILTRLKRRLAEYDGKAVSMLGEAQAVLSGEAGFLDALIKLIGESEGNIANGASWLIKAELESGNELSRIQTAELIDKACQLQGWAERWPTQLHICQSIQYFDIPQSHAEKLGNWIDPLLEHHRPFLRAWSLDGLAQLARQHGGFSSRFEDALERALADEAASVRARARKLEYGKARTR